MTVIHAIEVAASGAGSDLDRSEAREARERLDRLLVGEAGAAASSAPSASWPLGQREVGESDPGDAALPQHAPALAEEREHVAGELERRLDQRDHGVRRRHLRSPSGPGRRGGPP